MKKRKEQLAKIFDLHRRELCDQDILEMYLVHNLSQQEISKRLNLSRSQTKQNIAKAIFNLRKLSNDPEYIKARKILYGS